MQAHRASWPRRERRIRLLRSIGTGKNKLESSNFGSRFRLVFPRCRLFLNPYPTPLTPCYNRLETSRDAFGTYQLDAVSSGRRKSPKSSRRYHEGRGIVGDDDDNERIRRGSDEATRPCRGRRRPCCHCCHPALPPSAPPPCCCCCCCFLFRRVSSGPVTFSSR